MLTYNGVDLEIIKIKQIFLVKEKEVVELKKNILESIFGESEVVEISNYLNSYYYFKYEKDKLFFTKNLLFFKKNNIEMLEDEASKFMMLELGYVLPPYTMYKDVYRVLVNSRLTIDEKDTYFNFYMKSLHWKIKPQIELTLEEALLKFEALLKENLANKIINKNAVFTLSGGADSSLILKLSENFLKNDDIVVTIESPGQNDELIRAKKICSDLKINQVIMSADIKEYDKVRIKYIEKYCEPIFDQIAPLEYEMIKKSTTNDRIIVEGQAADSLFMGLPHNLALNLYKELGYQRYFYIIIANILNKFNFKKNTQLGRFFSRLKKLSNSFKEKNKEDFIINILGLQKLFLEENKEYIKRFEDSIKGLKSIYSDHYLISYFFMYRILPVREMQKYRMLVDEGYEFSFPYIEGNIIEFFQLLPEKFLINKKRRKILIFDLCKKKLKDINFNGKTTPFYIDIKNSEGDLENDFIFKEEVNKVKDSNIVFENLKNYILFKKIF